MPLSPTWLKIWFRTEAKAPAIGAIESSPLLEIGARFDRPIPGLWLGLKSKFSITLGIDSIVQSRGFGSVLNPNFHHVGYRFDRPIPGLWLGLKSKFSITLGILPFKEKTMSHILTDFKAFLDASPTSWHAVKEISERLAIREFHPLNEEEKWHLEPGKKYFVTKGGALCAFCLPQKTPERAIILASHTDSPALKLKPLPSFSAANMIQFGVEVYGAPLLSSWLNRDLVLAGRVVVTNSAGHPEEKLVHLDDAIFFIPQLAIHLDREVNEKGLHLNKQEHLCPIVGLSDEKNAPLEVLEKLLRRHLSFHSLLSFELFLVSHELARSVGLENEMIASYRIDNLASAHSSLAALGMIEKPSDHVLQIGLF